MRLSVGDRLGPYEIVAPIGAGGMGEVYKARDTRLDRVVAIKVSREQFSERFEREARAVAALNHPHICQLYDVGPNYLVMEFVEGLPLQGPLPVEKAVEYAGQILDALDAAHRKGITHRDLKPANILVAKQGIKLLDFGLAKQRAPLTEADATLTAALTSKGQILGTLQYMSPEQLHGQEADPRSDLFSFGCVLYEMLTGKRAFEGQSAASVIAAILEREPAPLKEASPLERVVRQCLAKDPDQRFQTARDLKRALAWALEQPPATTAPRPARRWWIAVAAALILGSFGTWAVLRYRQPRAEERVLRYQIDPPQGGAFVVPTGPISGGLAISPDGKTAAYVATVNGRTGLWVRPLDGLAARLVSGTEGAAFPFWSPDSKAIAFSARGKFQRVDPAGGAPVAICGEPSIGGSWDRDGSILFGTVRSGLFRVSASGGAPSPVTTLDTSSGEFSHRWPQALPGGRFLYWVQALKPESRGVYAASFAKPAKREKLLTTDSNAVYAPGPEGKGYLLWRRGGALVAQEFDPVALRLAGEPHPIAESLFASYPLGLMSVTASPGGLLLYGSFGTPLTQLTWFDRTGKRLGVIGEPVEHFSTFRLSPDGRRIAEGRPEGHIWLLEAERGLSSPFTAGAMNPLWSPDSRTIVFGRLDPPRLFRKDANGVGDEHLVAQRPRFPFPTDWSGDGQWILTTEGIPFAIWVLPMTPEGNLQEGAKPKPYLRTPFNEMNGSFSPAEPSPRWVAYQSDESGRYEVYIGGFPQPRGKKQISTAGGENPQWGAGGRELFYVSPDNKLMVVSLKLRADSVEPSVPRELFRLPPPTFGLGSPYEATRDGQRFLALTGQEQASPPLNVIVNWPALLKKGATAQ
jgi:eukaryotic-like serine/threonine-protein kinase